MRIAHKSFTGGETSPTLSARYDLARYQTFAQCMENFLPNLHGAAIRRPGTRFVADVGQYSLLIPFSFNADASQNFCLVFAHRMLRISDGVRMLPALLPTPYDAGDLAHISYAQVGDMVYLAHRNYPLHKLMRSGTAPHFTWALRPVALNTSLPAPEHISVQFKWSLPGNEHDDKEKDMTHPLRYKVVAVDADGKESLASPVGQVMGKHPSDWVVGNAATVFWRAVQGAVEYNIYREEAGYFGFVGLTKASQVVGAPPSQEQIDAMEKARQELEDTENKLESEKKALTSLVEKEKEARKFYDDCKDYASGETSPSCLDEQQQWLAAQKDRKDQDQKILDLGEERKSKQAELGKLHDAVYITETFVDNNYTADAADTPREDWNPFEDGNHPGVVAFHQQRMVLAATPKSPQAFYMSRVGDFENFRKSRPLQDDDPVEYFIASGSIDAITWAASFGDLLLGTSGREYKATGGGDGPITAKNISITAQSYWGSAALPPIIIGNSIMHVQRHGARVRDLFYSLEKDGYAGNDLSIMAPHLFDGHSLRQWAYQQTPNSTIWMVRDDGVLLALTYMKEHEIWGWSRHVTRGAVVSVATLSGENEDVVLLLVRRMVNGVEKYCLERMAPYWREADGVTEAYYMDCGVTVRREAPTADVYGLDFLEGRRLAVLADGSPVEGCVVQGGKITLPYAARVVHAGLPFTSVLSTMPVEGDLDTGSTLGRQRAYGRCTVRLHASVGGKYGSARDAFYDFPFVPAAWGEPCELFSGDLDFVPGGGQGTRESLWLAQDAPLPFTVAGLAAQVDFGQR